MSAIILWEHCRCHIFQLADISFWNETYQRSLMGSFESSLSVPWVSIKVEITGSVDSRLRRGSPWDVDTVLLASWGISQVISLISGPMGLPNRSQAPVVYIYISYIYLEMFRPVWNFRTYDCDFPLVTKFVLVLKLNVPQVRSRDVLYKLEFFLIWIIPNGHSKPKKSIMVLGKNRRKKRRKKARQRGRIISKSLNDPFYHLTEL